MLNEGFGKINLSYLHLSFKNEKYLPEAQENPVRCAFGTLSFFHSCSTPAWAAVEETGGTQEALINLRPRSTVVVVPYSKLGTVLYSTPFPQGTDSIKTTTILYYKLKSCHLPFINETTTVEALLTDTVVSGQLYLRPPSQIPVFLSSHTNSVYIHSRELPAPLHFRVPRMTAYSWSVISLSGGIMRETEMTTSFTKGPRGERREKRIVFSCWAPSLVSRLAASTLARACTPITKSEEKLSLVAVFLTLYTRTIFIR